MQAALLMSRRFAPLFVTQFLGAFNDNVFKNALVLLIAFREVTLWGIPPAQMVALCGAVFIAPYFLFSAIAGQLSDKYDKSRVMRATKVGEVVIMLIGAAGFWFGQVPLLVLVLFLTGVQSTAFGPSKYAILPQHLNEAELVAGNALVEMGTYLAILLGTLTGGILIGIAGGEQAVAVTIVVVAGLGLLSSLTIPSAPSTAPGLRIQLDPIRPTFELIRLSRKTKSVWLAILGVSWFWAFGSMFLSLFPSYTKDVLGGQESLATLFLALFSIGIGFGSMLCEKLSRERLELGVVPIGSFGMSLFTLDLWLVGQPWGTPEVALTVGDFLSQPSGWRIAIDLALLAVMGGLMIVPMYTLMQWRTDRRETSRVIAANNVINAVFIVAASLALAGLFALGLDTVDVFLVLAIVNAAVSIYIYSVLPEFMLRFIAWTLANIVYRIRVDGHSNVPIDGPVVLVCNHVSFADWLVLMAAIKRPARYVMHHSYYNLPVAGFLFRQARVIPIASAKEDPDLLNAAFDRIYEELSDDQVICIFPEGRITETGEMAPFRSGIERIVSRSRVPVIPLALNGLWGSFFSRRHGSAMTKPFRRMWSRVHVGVGEPMHPDGITAQAVQEKVMALWSAHPDA